MAHVLSGMFHAFGAPSTATCVVIAVFHAVSSVSGTDGPERTVLVAAM
ncbi:hypothetical protein RAA17_00520 [Komagataeibacter rhaeticus]|nr:hypothetical protein [Komagataeibacter rhaeticus]